MMMTILLTKTISFMMKLYTADKRHEELIGILELQLVHSVMLPLQLVFRRHCLFATL
jgi:hypothetical protein